VDELRDQHSDFLIAELDGIAVEDTLEDPV
jgi:hypothetical protein